MRPRARLVYGVRVPVVLITLAFLFGVVRLEEKPAPVLVRSVECDACTKAGAYQPCSLAGCLRCDEACCRQGADKCCCLHSGECEREPAPTPPDDPTTPEAP